VRWDDALGLPLWTDSFLHLKHNLYSVYYIIMKVRSQKSKSCGFSTLLSPKTKLYSLITLESYLCESGLNPLKESKIRFWLDWCHFLGLGKEPFERHEWWWPMAFEARFALGFICLHAWVCSWLKSIIIKPHLSSRVNPRDSPALLWIKLEINNIKLNKPDKFKTILF